jgi:hypothetical protein
MVIRPRATGLLSADTHLRHIRSRNDTEQSFPKLQHFPVIRLPRVTHIGFANEELGYSGQWFEENLPDEC